MEISHLPFRRQIKLLARKGRTFSKIFLSNVDIKYLNYKTKITFYVINRERKILKNKYVFINGFILYTLKKYYNLNYKLSIMKIFRLLEKYNASHKYIFFSSIIRKNKFIQYKLEYLNKFIYFKKLYSNIIISSLFSKLFEKYLNKLTKHESIYSLNQSKLNNLILLPKLSYLLNNILEKKIEYNIVNLKSITHNTHIFTTMLGKIIKRKKKLQLVRDMGTIIDRVRLPKVNTVSERTRVTRNIEEIFTKYNDSKLINNINNYNNMNLLINDYTKHNTENKIHPAIFHTINYKNMSGLKIEIKGRLTKRYRADRALYKIKYKGGLRNVYSSYQGLSSVLFRGNIKANTSYSFYKSKRRIGSFAVKG
jgi:hypothetical protein